MTYRFRGRICSVFSAFCADRISRNQVHRGKNQDKHECHLAIDGDNLLEKTKLIQIRIKTEK